MAYIFIYNFKEIPVFAPVSWWNY